jgi:outer membrane immunogenic protein
MNFKLTAALAAIIGLGAAQTAVAADLPARPVYKAPVMMPVYNWSGVYVGAHIGGGWSSADIIDPTSNESIHISSSGFLGGGQIGANWQWSSLVLGLQADISGTDLSSTEVTPFSPTSTVSHKTDWVATVTGRIGYAQNNWLAYAKGGVAFAHNKYSLVDPSIPASAFGSDTRTGWTVGGGLEYGFAPNWSGFIEYDYIDFGSHDGSLFSTTAGVDLPATLKQNIQMVKAGINYRFNTMGGPGGW